MSRLPITIVATLVLWAGVGSAQYAPVPKAEATPAAATPAAATPAAATPATATPAAPAAATAAETAPAQAAAGTGTECLPACRDGFMCHEGQCISSCNPPCGAGLECTSAGQCVAAAQAAPSTAPPLPAVAPSPADEPPPPGAWKPRFKEKRRNAYHFRPYVGLHLGLGGAGTSSYSSTSDYYYSNDDYDLGVSAGFEAGFEFRFGRIFGIGPAVRLYGFDHLSTSVVDVLLTPTFHIPIGIIEILVPLQIGPSFVSDDYDNSGAGLVFGVTPGLAIWVTKFFGIYAQFGATIHVLSSGDYATVAYRPVLNSGVTFGF